MSIFRRSKHLVLMPEAAGIFIRTFFSVEILDWQQYSNASYLKRFRKSFNKKCSKEHETYALLNLT